MNPSAISETETNNSELIEPAKSYDEKITSVNGQFFSALEDFKKYYVYFNKNPEVDEFQNYYANSKSQLQTMSKEVGNITKSIDKQIEALNAQMSSISEKIAREKELNEKHKAKLHRLENTQNGSEILVDDSKTAYNIQYVRNWEMFIGVLIVTGLIFKIYKAPIKQ
jgi:chromosome segregation ATPase